MKILAVANHKGGVGKTTTTYALGAALCGPKKRVLMIDCDPQASLTTACKTPLGRHKLDAAMGGKRKGTVPLAATIVRVGDHLDLVPACNDLAATEQDIASRLGRDAILRGLIAALDKTAYAVVLLDCPPALGLLTLNALCAADQVIVPTLCHVTDLYGLKWFLSTVESVRADLNPQLKVMGIVPTLFDARLRHHQEAVSTMLEADLPLVKTRIGRSIKVAEAAGHGQTVLQYAPDNKQVKNYQALAKEAQRCLSA